MKLSIEEQLEQIKRIKKDNKDNPKKYKHYDKPKFLKNNRWGIRLNIRDDYNMGMEGDALTGANAEEITFYKEFIKYYYNAELIGNFKNIISREDLADRQAQKDIRKEDIIITKGAYKKGGGLHYPDSFSFLTEENGSMGFTEMMDLYTPKFDTDLFDKHLNKFELETIQQDKYLFKLSSKKTKEFISEDIEFKIIELGHNRGLTLIEGLRRFAKMDEKARHMNRQNNDFNKKNKNY